MAIIIGIDAHKDTHTAVAVDGTTAAALDERCVAARDHGHDELLAWANGLDMDRTWAIEDCRSLSGGLELALLEAGETVIRVPPKMMSAYRKSGRVYGKSDPIDALAVARAAFHEPDLPHATFPGVEEEIGLLVDHRNNIMDDCAKDQRRLRWHLHQIAPGKNFGCQWRNQPGQLDRLGRWLARHEQTVRVRVCRDLVNRIRAALKHAKEIERELRDLVRATCPALLNIAGCGTLCAAQIIGEVAGVARFTNEAQLASYAGVSPIPASSGKNQRHRLNRYGNRRLNRAIHIIAVTQMRMHPPAREYIARRLEEGKTSREAQRTLKRYITRAVFNTLKTADLTT